MSRLFERYIGIDYSGAGDPTVGNRAIQVFRATAEAKPVNVHPESGGNWSRTSVTAWLIKQMSCDQRLIVGIDHAFGLPQSKMGGATSWTGFLEEFRRRWQSDSKPVTKAVITNAYADCSKLLRLTERWTSSAKSVFDCMGPGVACSTFAGLPWLYHMRQQCAGRLFFWPFDGWNPETGRHVVAEVYPSIFRNRYPDKKLTGDARDAYAVARWLREADARGLLPKYFQPPLTEAESETARLEGWILGVS